jgi:hypothetical protein
MREMQVTYPRVRIQMPQIRMPQIQISEQPVVVEVDDQLEQ